MKVHPKQKVKLFLTFMIIFIYFIHGIWWNDNTRLDLVKAIVDENRFEIDSYYNNTGDRSYYNGHYYSDKAPGLSFLATPIYTIIKSISQIFPLNNLNPLENVVTIHQINNGIVVNNSFPGLLHMLTLTFSIIFIICLFSALTVFLVYKITKFYTNNETYRLLVTIIYGTGTLVFQYSLVFYSHIAETFFVFLTFYIILKIKHKKQLKPRLLLIAGILLGFSIVISYTAVFLFVLLFLYLFYIIGSKKIFYFVIGAFTGILPLIYYNFSIFGTPFDFTQLHMDPNIWPNLQNTSGFVLKLRPFILYRLLFDPYRGFFFYHPVMITSFVGLFYMYKKHKQEALLILTIFIVLLLINSMWWAWEGGTSVGARHLIPVIPFLMLPILFFLQSTSKIAKTLLLVLALISISTNVILLQEWEWLIAKPFTVEPSIEFKERFDSFEILANPLFDHYLPLFIRNGPRARIVESIFYGNFDIRDEFTRETTLPYFSTIPLLLIISILWRKELIYYIKRLL